MGDQPGCSFRILRGGSVYPDTPAGPAGAASDKNGHAGAREMKGGFWAGGHPLISDEAAVNQLSGVQVLKSLPQLRRNDDQECLELGDRPGAAPHR